MMKRKQGRPRIKRDPWDFEGPYSVEPLINACARMKEVEG